MPEPDLYCNFCGRREDQVLVLIRGPSDIRICDLCVDLCVPIVEKHRTATPEELLRDAEARHAELLQMARGSGANLK
jgi:ATP-dependent protease Clp ATPase subunit